MTRLLALAACLLLSGCYGSYASGRSAADVPAAIRLIHLLGVENISDEPRRPVEVDLSDPRATRGETEPVPGGMDRSHQIVALFKDTLVAQFETHGILVVERLGSAPPDLAIHLQVYYAGGMFEREPAVQAHMVIRSRSGQEIRREHYVYSVTSGILRPSPEFVARLVARRIVDQAMAEIRKGSGAAGTAAFSLAALR
jgi:hypothetical protein